MSVFVQLKVIFIFNKNQDDLKEFQLDKGNYKKDKLSFEFNIIQNVYLIILMTEDSHNMYKIFFIIIIILIIFLDFLV
jgi:hypothetical protein